MAQYRRVCDVHQGYDHKEDKQTIVGYITALDIGGTQLPADQRCKDPMSPGSDIAVVAVLSDVLWELGVTDGVYFSGQISVYNKQTLMGFIYNSPVSFLVTYNFDVYDYDPAAKKYFKSFTAAGTTMKGLLEKRGEDLNLTVADDVSTEVQSPENYAFSIGIKPQPVAQSLTVVTADGTTVVKAWGLTVC